jgi:hypothetical protein
MEHLAAGADSGADADGVGATLSASGSDMPDFCLGRGASPSQQLTTWLTLSLGECVRAAAASALVLDRCWSLPGLALASSTTGLLETVFSCCRGSALVAEVLLESACGSLAFSVAPFAIEPRQAEVLMGAEIVCV